jgi:5-methylcytosine-specific restriction endonuclease McrA
MTKKQIKKLDDMWSAKVHSTGNKCECCGKTNCRLEAHHIFTRARRSTRWDLVNSLLLCSNCHKFSATLSAHTAPRAFFQWLENKKGKDWVDELEKKSNQIFKGTYEEVLTYLLG